jgi:hypothetical protein
VIVGKKFKSKKKGAPKNPIKPHLKAAFKAARGKGKKKVGH